MSENDVAKIDALIESAHAKIYFRWVWHNAIESMIARMDEGY